MKEKVHFFERGPRFINRIDESYQFIITGYLNDLSVALDLYIRIGSEIYYPVEDNVPFYFDSKLSMGQGFIFKFHHNIENESSLLIELFYISNNSEQNSTVIQKVEILPPPKKVNANITKDIAICMATYNPNITQFKNQIRSITNQIIQDWTLIINDDFSDPKIYEEMVHFTQIDPRIKIFRNPMNIGFYLNFERLLRRVTNTFSYIALSDQDDFWDRNKLKENLTHLSDNELVYSDLMIIDSKMRTLKKTFWSKRSNHGNSKRALCLNNALTGSTIVFKYSTLKKFLPFPQAIGRVFHDHWIAYRHSLQAKCKYIDQPLVKYVQHGNNETGFSEFELPKLSERLISNFALFVILSKIILKRDINKLNHFIEINQNIYYEQLQRYKQFLSYYSKSDKSTDTTNIKALTNLLTTAVTGYFKKWHFNRYDKDLYSSILLISALKIRRKIRS